jgi:hypothetical protein
MVSGGKKRELVVDSVIPFYTATVSVGVLSVTILCCCSLNACMLSL